MESFEGSGGVEIAFDQWPGDPDRPAVVLHHGFAADTPTNWVAPGIVSALEATGRRVVSIDARGHGRSAKPSEPRAHDSPAMADDLVDRLVGALSGSRLAMLEGDHLGVVASPDFAAAIVAFLDEVDTAARAG